MTERINMGYTPHSFQKRLADEMKRFTVLVCHRRFGKTVFAVARLVSSALNASNRGKQDARFAYVAPYLKQAKEVAWTYLCRFTRVIPGAKCNETENSVVLPNGAKVRLFGADNPDAMRGMYFDGVVLDEVADMRPQVWGEIIRPAMADRKGWALFIGTPKGINLFYDLYMQALKTPQDDGYTPGWHAGMYTVNDTVDELPHLDWEEVNLAKATMSDAQFRQEMLCDFQAASDNVLLTIEAVEAAAGKHLEPTDYAFAPKVIGVDVARFGDDRSCIIQRQGLYAHQPRIFRDLDNMQLAGHVANLFDNWGADAIFVDGGRGEGVIDRLRQLGYPVIEVQFGGKPADRKYANKRSEMWDLMRVWVNEGGAIPPCTELKRDLVGPTYGFDAGGRLVLEKKEDMKKRGLPSSDVGDALATTFAFPVKPRDTYHPVMARTNYDPHQYGVSSSTYPTGVSYNPHTF